MSAQHTPGPWEVFEHSWSDSSVCGGDGNIISICRLSIYDEATEETQGYLESMMDANARLIAAAPDLLEALQAIISTGGDFDKSLIATNLATSAIIKATQKP